MWEGSSKPVSWGQGLNRLFPEMDGGEGYDGGVGRERRRRRGEEQAARCGLLSGGESRAVGAKLRLKLEVIVSPLHLPTWPGYQKSDAWGGPFHQAESPEVAVPKPQYIVDKSYADAYTQECTRHVDTGDSQVSTFLRTLESEHTGHCRDLWQVTWRLEGARTGWISIDELYYMQ